MRVETREITTWEIDEDSFFAEFDQEWQDFLEDIGGEEDIDGWDKRDFIIDLLYNNAPDFAYFGGRELYDDYEIDLQL